MPTWSCMINAALWTFQNFGFDIWHSIDHLVQGHCHEMVGGGLFYVVSTPNYWNTLVALSGSTKSSPSVRIESSYKKIYLKPPPSLVICHVNSLFLSSAVSHLVTSWVFNRWAPKISSTKLSASQLQSCEHQRLFYPPNGWILSWIRRVPGVQNRVNLISSNWYLRCM